MLARNGLDDWFQHSRIQSAITLERLSLKLKQEQVGERLGVDECSVYGWENGCSKPSIEYMPAIIQFLGYNPLPAAKTLGERLVRHRTSMGLSQAASAKRMGVDPATLARWERDERKPSGTFTALVKDYLAQPPIAVLRLRSIRQEREARQEISDPCEI